MSIHQDVFAALTSVAVYSYVREDFFVRFFNFSTDFHRFSQIFSRDLVFEIDL